MKIGILTFHYSINQGSVLQAYCVYKLLVNRFPEAQVEIINLVPWNREVKEWNFISKKFPFVKTANIRRYLSLRKFVRNNMNQSVRKYYRNLNDQIDFINSLGYNYIITGSDTVWMDSPKLDNLLPNIYYLPTPINAKKLSIAASIDPLKNPKRFYDNRECIYNTLGKYSSISVRDNLTYDTLTQLGVNNIVKIADPTLLYNFEDDLKIQTKRGAVVKKNRVHLHIADVLLEKRIEKSLNGTNEYSLIKRQGDHSFDDFVLDDLNQYHDIDILITDRFHRSIFAIKLSSALVINIERYDKNPIAQSKGRDLFSDIGIQEYCLRYEQGNNAELINKINNCISSWSSEKLIRRDHLLNEYILKNTGAWETFISGLITHE